VNHKISRAVAKMFNSLYLPYPRYDLLNITLSFPNISTFVRCISWACTVLTLSSTHPYLHWTQPIHLWIIRYQESRAV